MPITFSPSSGEHTEFEGAYQTVAVIDPPDLQFEILEVSYKHEYGMVFSDLNLTFNTKSFHYFTKYEYAVSRPTFYTLLPDKFNLEKHKAQTISDIPPEYYSIYRVDNPPESSWVKFTIQGRERTVTQTTDPNTGQSQTTYGQWYSKTYEWIDTVNTNFTRHCQFVTGIVKNGQLALSSPITPEI